jgi:fatty acid desaturase
MQQNPNDRKIVALLAAESDGDYSASFATIREHITDSHGTRLVDYVAQLTPRYWRIYLDLTVGCAALVAVIVLICIGQIAGISPNLLISLGAVLIGFWFFYLVSFIHEGVHWNLTRDRNTNDLICQALTSCMLGVHLDVWRKHHFEHHRSLGTVRDTETTYFFPLNIIAFLKSASGLRAIEALAAYVRWSCSPSRRSTQPGAPVAPSHLDLKVGMGLIVGIMSHGLMIAGLWIAGWTAASIAWALAVGAVTPVLNTIRQVLEHRSSRARADVDYLKTDQGACARLFGNGWLDSLFGSAGANRHLVHHWESQVSYTRLADLERFLADTPARAIMERRRTTYYKAFRELFSA